MGNILTLAPVLAGVGLVLAGIIYMGLKRQSQGNETMREIAGLIHDGAMVYLKRQYTILIAFVIVVALLLAAFININTSVAYIFGAISSMVAGFFGMKAATRANVRTAEAANLNKPSSAKALATAFFGGSVMGLSVASLGLLGVGVLFIVFGKPETAAVINGFAMGASTIALFARVGGGIYTKAADVGADLVGKVEAGIPEDDPRNPATIADNVGDNVGDVAGMGADLYESYCGSILATAALGAALPGLRGDPDAQGMAVVAPMIVAGIGIILSIAGIFMVRAKESATQKNLLNALLLGTGGSSVLILIAMAIMASQGWVTWGIFGAVVAGLFAGVVIGQGTELFTSDEYKATKGIAAQTQQGPATTIIDGMAVGMYSTWIPVVTIVIGIIAAFGFSGGFTEFSNGVYGIGFAAVGMLSTLGITLATDAFGPIADNAGGNAEMSELPPEVRERTDALDMLGNTTAATGKGFAIGSAALTAMALLAAYMEEVRLWLGKLADKTVEGVKQVGDTIFYTDTAPAAADGLNAVQLSTANIHDFVGAYDLSIFNPMLLGGIFIGAMMAFVFCAMTMKAVGRAAGSMVDEVRRQFRDIPGIMEGKATPEYAKCVEISTKGAQREMLLPSLLAIIVPVTVGVVLGVAGVVGLLVGGLTTGFTLAVMLNNAGGAWDNAKKYIEKGNYGGKGSDSHHAAVVGDTVGDPFKDTSGPSLNILIKLMTMVSVVMAGLTVALGLFS